MKKLLLSVLACSALSAGAQVSDTKNYLYLYSDSIIYAKKILLRPDFSGYWQLRVDSRRVPVDQVKFFNNEDGFFANTNKLSFNRISQFSERIIEGRINLFQQRTYDPYDYDRSYRYGHDYGHDHGRSSAVAVSTYYNKGFGDLKKVNYRNLKYDMADHPESMKFLNTYRKRSNLSKIMYATAGASMIAGVLSVLRTKSDNDNFPTGNHFGSQPSLKSPNFTATYVLMGVGLGIAGAGYAVQSSGARNLENAIDAYNR